MTYLEKLKDKRWQQKRLLVLDRDKWTCTECVTPSNSLHVHHKRYAKSGNPWDATDEDLCTLCERCHETEEALKKRNVDVYAFAKSANITCTAVMRWIATLSFMKKYKPGEYRALADMINDSVIFPLEPILCKHIVSPDEDLTEDLINAGR